VVVSTVGKLCEIINKDVSEQVKQVLGPEDLQRYLLEMHLE
jgi:centrosomal protein CEP70